ncbi:hypothetical protein AXK56_22620 [Tsukamurella pulmonis]|uniref:Nucleotidyl transferase AbiEii toxin, Type IV TA system n=1 Tax=Tsukamurella pulmonis TaxID=47312 RepID=A0A1H1AE51_9ACTN|nr:nucleotidyl transferase AbiEii/AbiGii toxin family protein [Tsukamurella pulmonis]KXO92802.1 hypothetical protein AXK56_22620 [Tsukamurella pulmonis]SDQ37851.1 Nucleotidyl transferase AbiEii toxin, Type IV TA system [Tsukamurella pulmonis]SUQ39359.1 Uncharacterised protein [Tsukamurella pulmonis]
MALSSAQEAAAVILLATGAGEISLAGGAGLITHGVIDRDTEDLDAFTRHMKTSTHELADRVRGAFERANYRVVDDSAYPDATLRRLLVTPRAVDGATRAAAGRKPETVKVEIGQDFQALPAIVTPIGPVLDPLELGANKILTVYNVTRARDGDDLARLATRYPFARMLEVADQKEVTPLDRGVLADQMSLFARLPDSEFPWLRAEEADAVKTYMTAAAEQLRAGRPVDVVSPYAEPSEDRGAALRNLLNATQSPQAQRSREHRVDPTVGTYRPQQQAPGREERDRGLER